MACMPTSPHPDMQPASLGSDVLCLALTMSPWVAVLCGSQAPSYGPAPSPHNLLTRLQSRVTNT